MADFEHLRIEREPLENDRRTRRTNIPRYPRGDLAGHGQKLTNDLTQTFRFARQQQTSRPGNFVLKLRYIGYSAMKSNTFRRLAAVSPRNDETNASRRTMASGKSSSNAITSAARVLPQPGGP